MEKMVGENKHDVFISYSRKDYVNENKDIIPGNIISKIKDALSNVGIRYWFDNEGIFSGDEFAPVIAKAIKESKIFLFVSTINSNNSEWTSNEIATAHIYKKKIIPFLVDDSIFNDSVIMYLAKLDYICYSEDPEKALSRLINSINNYLNPISSKDSFIQWNVNYNLKGLDLLDSLRVHIHKKDTLSINYKTYKGKMSKNIIIFPHMLKEFRCRWFLVGTEHNNMQISSFALDRIISFKVEPIIPYNDPSINIMHYFDNVIGISRPRNATPEDILFWASKEMSNYIRTKPLHKSQVIINDYGDKGTLFRINVIINLELFSIFMSYGDGIRILKPYKVVRHLKKELKRVLDLYDNTFSWIDQDS